LKEDSNRLSEEAGDRDETGPVLDMAIRTAVFSTRMAASTPKFEIRS
jgi:hypothetical protein